MGGVFNLHEAVDLAQLDNSIGFDPESYRSEILPGKNPHLARLFPPTKSGWKPAELSCWTFERLGICVDENCSKRHFKTNVVDHCWEFAEGKCPRGKCQWAHISEE